MVTNKSESKPIISLHQVTKVYGKGDNAVEALRGIDLDIRSGEAIAIIGRSGSGKSTLAHVMATLDRPTSGKVLINGSEVGRRSRRASNRLRNQEIGFVFQQFFMNARDSVLDNVMLPMVIAGIRPKLRRKRALDALETVGLLDKAYARASDLSGGQKQRVCIARAIVNKPSIILADEPTGNLDTATSRVVEDMLFRLNQERGITLVIVTHDPDLAQRCGRQVRIADGQVVGDQKERK
ncbi:ABC transporter ATP-binding protein [Candidatus Saccharibacteria bacterium]|jgi:ABC transporter, ATP-binding protein|uniref:ABC transporter ATP-binding protein n=1 Tax=Candidatus Nanoperiomorbus periodonticus TaxID=2171989 RepID=UPI00101B8EED|nr:ABC transporter ATP-binding protein [Candidatus Nanoperiomorbus periodonticus]MCG5106243.1 ABC transporter ATP-binding protein [Candidatus Saccharibacteria bacterium]RYC76453.1 putative ABC transporter ATP-binding protein YknY [Candidatus Nanoperiomorbus periodonticus]